MLRDVRAVFWVCLVVWVLCRGVFWVKFACAVVQMVYFRCVNYILLSTNGFPMDWKADEITAKMHPHGVIAYQNKPPRILIHKDVFVGQVITVSLTAGFELWPLTGAFAPVPITVQMCQASMRLVGKALVEFNLMLLAIEPTLRVNSWLPSSSTSSVSSSVPEQI